MLQDCPNCGGRPKLRKRNKYKVYYECDGDCWTQTNKYYTEEEAAREWNSLVKRKEDET